MNMEFRGAILFLLKAWALLFQDRSCPFEMKEESQVLKMRAGNILGKDINDMFTVNQNMKY